MCCAWMVYVSGKCIFRVNQRVISYKYWDIKSPGFLFLMFYLSARNQPFWGVKIELSFFFIINKL